MKMRAQLFMRESAAPREAEIEGTCEDRDHLAAELLERLRAPAPAQRSG
jgi:hypothetical protein